MNPIAAFHRHTPALRVALALLVITAAGSAWAQVASTSAVPQIVCERPVYDFGVVGPTQVVQHVFVMENRGGAPLVITRVHGCCGATMELGAKTIAPGTNTTFEIKLTLAGRRGQVNKAFYLHSNDPMTPIYQLRMLGSCAASPAATNGPPAAPQAAH